MSEIFLQLELRKALQRDAHGNVIFTVEASNENLDLEGQRVLQEALLGTKGYFLKNGVVSKDHKHRKMNDNGSYEINEEFVIGEPLEVFTEGRSTLVKGKLYAKNKYAQKFIELLEQGSSRVKASVGGLVPKVKSVMENGKNVGNVVSVLWDDLALTITPVNPTVESATSLAKALSGKEFVKALSAGYGTDSAAFVGGRALQKEDVEDNEKQKLSVNEKAIASLVGAIADGDITDPEEAESFLAEHGFSKEEARETARTICKTNMEGVQMGKSSFWDSVKSLSKSLSAKDEDELEEIDEEEGEEEEDEEEEDYEDAGPLVKSLADEVKELRGVIASMTKAIAGTEALQKSIGQAMVALMERTDEISKSPVPRKGAVSPLEVSMEKSLVGGGMASGGRKIFTEEAADKTRDILLKAVSEKKIDLLTCGKWETQINTAIGKSMYTFTPDFIDFMKKEAV